MNWYGRALAQASLAAAVSLGLSQWVDAAIILAIVIGSTLLGFYQEYRASAAVEALTGSAS